MRCADHGNSLICTGYLTISSPWQIINAVFGAWIQIASYFNSFSYWPSLITYSHTLINNNHDFWHFIERFGRNIDTDKLVLLTTILNSSKCCKIRFAWWKAKHLRANIEINRKWFRYFTVFSLYSNQSCLKILTRKKVKVTWWT